MASRNVEYFRSAHQAFNRRDYDEAVSRLTPGCIYRDQATGQTFTGKEDFKEFMRGWVKSFSDGTVAEPNYIDAGDTVIAEFRGRGTNDGQIGDLSATGRRMDTPFCEIMHFNAEGDIVSGCIYYDQLSILTQLGLAQAPTGATADAR
jgi:steroid delta-isomerase-like uncharacterized protein